MTANRPARPAKQTKQSRSAKAVADRTRTLQIKQLVKDESRETTIARTVLRPTVTGASVIQAYSSRLLGELPLTELVQQLQDQTKKVNEGDLGRLEAMLTVQAHTLDAIFGNLAARAERQIVAGYIQAGELFLKLALRAQSQSRSTLEALAEIKNPAPVTFVRQANVAAGPQQVNNGSRADNVEKSPNKLLEKLHAERLDFGTPSKAISADSQLAAVGEGDRPENPRR